MATPPRSRARPLAHHSLAVALVASGLGPAGLALAALAGSIWSGLGVALLVVAFVSVGTAPITVPLALAALGSYRRQAGPSRGRAAWTAVVLAFLSPTAAIVAVVLYDLVVG